MGACMTPNTTALYNSYLDNDLFEASQAPSYRSAQDDEDIFAEAMVDFDPSVEQSGDAYWDSMDFQSTENAAQDQARQSSTTDTNASTETSQAAQKRASHGPGGHSSAIEYFPSPSRSLSIGGERISGGFLGDQSSLPADDYAQFFNAVNRRFSWPDKSTQQAKEQLELAYSPKNDQFTTQAPGHFGVTGSHLLPLSPPLSAGTSHSLIASSESPGFNPESAAGDPSEPTIRKPSSEAIPVRKQRAKRKQPTESEKQVKKIAFLERNRLAAGKCRTKKRGWVQQLEDDARTEQRRNVELKNNLEALMGEVAFLDGLLRSCSQEHHHMDGMTTAGDEFLCSEALLDEDIPVAETETETEMEMETETETS